MKNEWDEYAKDWEANPQVIEYSKLAYASLVKVVEIDGLNIFDFGCGTGLLSELLLPKAKSIVALDSSKEMASILNSKNLEKLDVLDELLTEDLISKNSLYGQFDLIVASSVCGFLPDYFQTLKLLKSMLVPNGLFVQWDWLVSEDNAITGMSENKVKTAFANAGIELSSLTEAFSMEGNESVMPVLMAVGVNTD